MNKAQITVNHAPRLLLVANVAKEHVLKFHIPTIKTLKAHGWTVDVACSGEEAVPYCDTQYHLSYQRSPFNRDLFKGIHELTKIINTGSYDVVYCHTPVGGVAARIAAFRARKKGTKVIYMAHGYHFFRGAPRMSWMIYYPVEKLLSRVTDAIILINKEDYELTIRKFKCSKAYLIDGIGIDFDRFDLSNRVQIRESYRNELEIPQNAQVLIYLAELIPNKNQTFLLDVLKKLLNDNDNVYLVLAGFDHSYGGVQRYAEEIGVADHVRFLGWREDVSNLYIMSDVCTATSIREGFGLNLVEAMYCGIPVVATKNRGHETIIRSGKNGFLVDLDDADGFARCVSTLIEDKDLYRKIVRCAGGEIEKYSSRTSAEKIEKILTEQQRIAAKV